MNWIKIDPGAELPNVRPDAKSYSVEIILCFSDNTYSLGYYDFDVETFFNNEDISATPVAWSYFERYNG